MWPRKSDGLCHESPSPTYCCWGRPIFDKQKIKKNKNTNKIIYLNTKEYQFFFINKKKETYFENCIRYEIITFHKKWLRVLHFYLTRFDFCFVDRSQRQLLPQMYRRRFCRNVFLVTRSIVNDENSVPFGTSSSGKGCVLKRCVWKTNGFMFVSKGHPVRRCICRVTAWPVLFPFYFVAVWVNICSGVSGAQVRYPADSAAGITRPCCKFIMSGLASFHTPP